MENLKIKKNSFGLRIYCSKCSKMYYTTNINKCKHPEYQTYKSIIYLHHKTKVKHYKTKKYDEALIDAINFKNEMKVGLNPLPEKNNPKNISIRDGVNLFYEYKADINVCSHLKQNLSEKYLGEIMFTMKMFIQILNNNNIDADRINIKNLNNNHVSFFYDHLINNYAEGSFSKFIIIMKSFMNYIIEEYDINMKNPFLKIKCPLIKSEIDAVTREEFDAILFSIDNSSPYQYIGKKNAKKNLYRAYLKDAFKLALLTGMRREELVELKWSDIFYSEKANCNIIKVINRKVERITKKSVKNGHIAINKELFDFLIEIGFEMYKGTDKYVISPSRNFNNNTMKNALSKGFHHYYLQAYPDSKKPKMLKSLRKTYMSLVYKEEGEDILNEGRHSNLRTLKNHYLDPEMILKNNNRRFFDD